MNELQWIRRNYRVPAKRGGRVRLGSEFGPLLQGETGTITGATHYLRVRMDDGRKVLLHPTWGIEYLPVEAQESAGVLPTGEQPT